MDTQPTDELPERPEIPAAAAPDSGTDAPPDADRSARSLVEDVKAVEVDPPAPSR